jgi:uncharacterized delta-60 repeat protein
MWLIAGDFTYVDGYRRGRIASLESDGTIHPGFDPGSGANGSVFSIARQLDGKILVGGSFTSFAGTERPLLVRLNPTGTLDPDFTSAIVPQVSTGGDVPCAVRYVVTQPDGKLLVAGTQLNSGPMANAGVVRLNDDGSFDPSFIPAAAVTNATILELQPDGKVLVGADNGYNAGSLLRLEADGALDPAFDADLEAIPHRAVRGVWALKVLPDGRILAGGMSVFSGGNIGLLVLEPDGHAKVHSHIFCVNRRAGVAYRAASLFSRFRMSRSETTRYKMSIANSTPSDAQTRQKNPFITTWL